MFFLRLAGRRSYDGAAARCSATEGRKNLRMNDVGMNLDVGMGQN